MKSNIILIAAFFSVITIAINSDGVERIGGTQLNGNGCVCHTTIESPNVHVWVEGPDSLFAGQTVEYKMYMFGGPAIAGGYNVAVRYGLLNVEDTLSVLIDNELTQSVSLPFASVYDTIYWVFLYTAPDSVGIDTMYSVGLSTNWDSIPDDRDQWAYGPKFPIKIIEDIVPVELISFNCKLIDSDILLSWSTASEKNNKGFEIQRSKKIEDRGEKWEFIGYVDGKGTNTQMNSYSFEDKNLSSGKYNYRLKQIDFDGTFKYYDLNETIEIRTPVKFELFQNYPNPFNPSTKIRYAISSPQYAALKVYDMLGNEVVTLLDEYKSTGSYEVEFSVGQTFSLSSGIYLIRLQAGNYVETKKMILLR